MKNRPQTRLYGLAAAVVMMSITFAGCSGPGAANEKLENKAPHAVLEASKNTGWTTDTFNFDASKSSDPDGHIVQYIFDFGDSTPPLTIAEGKQSSVSHNFAEGGEYTVTLTVLDDGAKDSGAKSDMTSKTVAVNQKFTIPPGVAASTPNNDTASKARSDFKVKKDADRIHVTVSTKSIVIAGGSRIQVRLLDPSDRELERKEYTVDSGQNHTFDLSQDLVTDNGMYHVEIYTYTGGASYDGYTEVFYDRGYIQ